MTADSLVETALQHGDRIVAMTPNGSLCSGVLVDDMSGLAATMRDRYEGVITSARSISSRRPPWTSSPPTS